MLNTARTLILGDGLRARALRGGGLTVLNFGVQNALRLASNLVLTRLLYPEAFGLMALIAVVLSAVAMFSDIGIRGAVIQDARGEEQAFLDTAWTVQLLRGVVIWLVICALARPLADFYDAPALATMLPVAGLSAILQGAMSCNVHVLDRNLWLERVVAMQIGAYVLSLVVMIVAAWIWTSVWALLAGTLVQPAAMAVFSHTLVPGRRNRPRLDPDSLRRLFSFGRFVFVATVASFFVIQGDRAILGKFVSLEDLAIYNIAYFLASVPMLLGGSLADRIMQPLYARRPPAESARNRHQIARARRLLTLGLIGAAAILGLVSTPLVTLLYDARYEAAGPVMTLIAVGLMPVLATISYHKLPLASGHSGRYAVLMTGLAVVQTGLLIFAVSRFGLVGVALTPPVAMLATYPLLLWIIRPYRGWDPLHDAIAFAASAGLAALVLAIHHEAVGPLFAAL